MALTSFAYQASALTPSSTVSGVSSAALRAMVAHSSAPVSRSSGPEQPVRVALHNAVLLDLLNILRGPMAVGNVTEAGQAGFANKRRFQRLVAFARLIDRLLQLLECEQVTLGIGAARFALIFIIIIGHALCAHAREAAQVKRVRIRQHADRFYIAARKKIVQPILLARADIKRQVIVPD